MAEGTRGAAATRLDEAAPRRGSDGGETHVSSTCYMREAERRADAQESQSRHPDLGAGSNFYSTVPG